MPQRGLVRSPSRNSIWCILNENVAFGETNFSDAHEELYIDFLLSLAKHFSPIFGAFAPTFIQ